MSIVRSAILALTGVVALSLMVPGVLAHGDEAGGMDMGVGEAGGMGGMMNMSTPDAKPDESSYPPTYFAHPEHQGLLWAHIVVMAIGWIIVLPVAVMFSLARSRLTLVLQFVFLAVNAFGVLLGTIYNASTPDLYPNNAHHKIGWVATWVVCAQVVVGLVGRVAGAFNNRGRTFAVPHGHRTLDEHGAFIPVSAGAMAEHALRFPASAAGAGPYRLSNDSGHGTEPNTESLRSPSASASGDDAMLDAEARRKEYARRDDGGDDVDEDDMIDDIDLEDDLPALPRSGRVYRLTQKVAGMCSSRARRFLMLFYDIIDRVIMPLGFVALLTGIIAQCRFFEGHAIFSGLAHWIKGSIFFWLGIFTLGRWAGSFGELGWAWNVRPRSPTQKWRPSSELVESFLIFFYGVTNVFLEHLGNAGKPYSPQDLEHLSITVLFIGGGLCGMLIESVRVRDLLNMTVTEAAHARPEETYGEETYGAEEDRDALKPPRQYGFSSNPIPALVILLTGIMMSSHTQQSMISTMVHGQWGKLLSGASFARGFTYVLMYLKPPRSILPSRPPTELLAAFGLIAGGVIFMASSSSTIDGMIHYGLDAMFFYTVTMGLVGVLMAWVIIVLALKGWAVRREARSKASYRMA